MRILDYIKENVVVLDGAMGTLLQESGLKSGELPERWNLSHPERIVAIHKAYLDAGSNLISTNTFGANILKFSKAELKEIISSAVNNARLAIKESKGRQEKWIALDIGPTGRMLKPLGDLDFEDAVSVFAETVRLGAECGVDVIFIETMSDSYETKAALLAAKENCDLPVFVSNAYGEDGKLMTGASPAAMVALLEGMGADAIGVNCSFGPDKLMPVLREYLKYSSLPVILKPNAGLPQDREGKSEYDVSPKKMAEQIVLAVSEGARAVGGCCGTTPEHIREISRVVSSISPLSITKKNNTITSSYTHAVFIGDAPVMIGERINPTGKPKFREAVKSGNIEYILREAIGQEDAGADILDVNLGIPGINESSALTDAVCRIQEVTSLPLQIDTSDAKAMEYALRRYNGKAMINSVNGKSESMAAVFPLAKKYGGVVVALTLDENGIPSTAEGRVSIARKILCEAEGYGIDKKDILFDPLAMAVSADPTAARETLKALRLINEELGAKTVLGVSNVSFGLPERDRLNAAYLVMALTEGLSAAIVNPYSDRIKGAMINYLALSGEDLNFEKYIRSVSVDECASRPSGETKIDSVTDLVTAVERGFREQAAVLAEEELKKHAPLEIINGFVAPALNRVGDRFEKKEIFLPSLLMSAEAASAALEVIKSKMPKGEGSSARRIVLATVKGDIHDIGKNIVKLVLESYGYEVTDLGKDVPKERILDAVLSLNADMVGLSALMTTTLPAMEETVRLIREKAPECKVMVGGAVLSEEYAKEIGADFYGKDAMDAVKFAKM